MKVNLTKLAKDALVVAAFAALVVVAVSETSKRFPIVIASGPCGAPISLFK